MTSAASPQRPWGHLVGVLLTALLAAWVEQVFHESVHAVAAILFGKRLIALNFWAVDHDWPDGTAHGLADGCVEGGAAGANIAVALACALAFPRLSSRSRLRLFVFYLGAYSGFAGFGYLLVDPIFAGPESIGDWAKVVMLLGGGMAARLPIIAVGAAGTVVGYFLVGRAAQHFAWGDPSDPQSRRRLGLTLCVLPYVAVSAAFSALTPWHPVGAAGIVAALFKLWFGFVGFFWSFMIIFVFGKDRGRPAQLTPLPPAPSPVVVTALLVAIALTPLLLRTLRLA